MASVDGATRRGGGDGSRRRRVLVFPLPFQGHINPMLQLAGALHGRGELSVTVLHTRFNAIDPSRYPELAFAEVPDGIPPDVAASGTVVDIIVALNVAMDGGESSSRSSPSPSFRDVLASVVAADDEGTQPRASCLIIDGNLIAAQKAAAELGLPTLVLRTGSAACLGCYLAYPTLLQKGYLPPKESRLYEPVEELPPLRVRDLFYSSDANQELVRKVLGWIAETARNSNGVVINTFDELEPAELEKIRGELDGDGVAVVLAAGPLHKLSSMNAGSSLHLRPERSCIEWLDTQATGSVLYVSFGSLASLDSDEFLEVAWGLESSGQPFLWVVRPDLVRGLDEPSLPDGFERVVEGRGKVIKWAPQQEVLAHCAVGGFWTHNGWNSTLESVSEGVPMICRPQFADQMLNTRFVEAVWAVGFELVGKLERGEIKKTIKRLMVEKEGAEIRERAKELKKKMDRCLESSGSSQIAIDRASDIVLTAMASARVVGGARHGGGRRRVLVFPLPFQGHINPMLQLAGALHGRGELSVTVLHTRFNALDPSRHPELAFIEVPDGIPPDVAARGRISEIILAMNATMEMEGESGAVSPSIREVLASVVAAGEGQPRVACLIIDSHLLAVKKAVAGQGIPTLVLRTGSAACLRCYLAYPTLLQKGYLPPEESQLYEPVKELPPLRVRDLLNTDDELVFEVLARIAETVRNSNGVVINTFEELEPTELERVRSELGDDGVATVLATGPLYRLSAMNTGSNSFNLHQDRSCIGLLDMQVTGSVLYVSFGSLASMDSDEFMEVAFGLEKSGHPFLWVVRPNLVRGGVERACLPDRFESAVGGRGKVIKWAPQQEVLAHRAVSGFWTHGGLNSILESVCEGVRMICRPQFADQMINTRYVEAVWGAGFELEGKLERCKIEKAIMKLMGRNEGAEMRERANELKNKVARCLEDGMDPSGVLMVRFHYGGEFLNVEGYLQYFGGNTGMSFIDLDKLSLLEMQGHLRDHSPVDHPVQLHWLYPGKDLNDGLRLLFDDDSCNVMAQHITNGGVVDIFVEDIDVDMDKEDNDWELEISPTAGETTATMAGAGDGDGRAPRGHVVLFPLPFQGHLSPMLQLAGALHARGLAATVLHTAYNAPDAAAHPELAFVAVPSAAAISAALAAAPKDGIAKIMALNAAIEASGCARDALASVMSGSEGDARPRPACLVIDAALPGAQKAAAELGLPTIVLHTGSAAAFRLFRSYAMLREKGYLPAKESELNRPVKEMPPLRVSDLFDPSKYFNEEMADKILALSTETTTNSSGTVVNTFEALETPELHSVRDELGAAIPVFAIGPLHKLTSNGDRSSLLNQDRSCIEWLDTKEPGSVLYVSFGSVVMVSQDEFREVAWGLANSGRPFLWVVRPGLVIGASGKPELPDGFVEAVEGRCKVVDWAPQMEVLAHLAVCGFWTHNGWNSTLESIYEGVPMLSRPIFGDQLITARYVQETWRIGFQVEGKLERGKIEEAIRRLTEGKEGAEVKQRADEFKKKILTCLENGGSTQQAIDKLDTLSIYNASPRTAAMAMQERQPAMARQGRQPHAGRRVALFPLPFQGHLSPMLQLAALLRARGLAVTVLHTGFNAPDPARHGPELAFVPIHEEALPEEATSPDADIVAQLLALNAACEAPFRDALASLLPAGVACAVVDGQWYAALGAAAQLGVPALALRTDSVATFRSMLAFPRLRDAGFIPIDGKNG
uniref:PB1-like domain-containing protein n=1 Tax=Oryza punctata TaxID=4537 RepID=A0A0E0LIU3_ORYPU